MLYLCITCYIAEKNKTTSKTTFFYLKIPKEWRLSHNYSFIFEVVTF